MGGSGVMDGDKEQGGLLQF